MTAPASGDGAGPRVVVVGLGPAGDDLVTAETLAAIERIPHRFLRTGRHPSAGVVPGAITFVDASAVAKGLKVVKIDGRAPGAQGYALR